MRDRHGFDVTEPDAMRDELDEVNVRHVAASRVRSCDIPASGSKRDAEVCWWKCWVLLRAAESRNLNGAGDGLRTRDFLSHSQVYRSFQSFALGHNTTKSA